MKKEQTLPRTSSGLMQIVFVTELQYFETRFSIYVWQLSSGILIPKDHSVIAQFIIVFQHTALQLLEVSRGLTVSLALL